MDDITNKIKQLRERRFQSKFKKEQRAEHTALAFPRRKKLHKRGVQSAEVGDTD